ncbi:Holliday junction branch migration protein RuvA [Promicromonospora thailandica]|uniref:Holliday junction branch migration complex subunit RuvA n=1 Tax=Promicromonospora thailandica TaxID=765201 RepID=A0A9X2G2S0_9MICO|nr:Holliday junction branch migration protein RuvA [Promicromonospora thailandica]MCP2265814.1 Holliday junction DNA helicase subunit RuvA [Promicromonospora thailandica]BFF21842.1 Holliday junction branch migration protein RuvA [Promicromonospora thailandica]
MIASLTGTVAHVGLDRAVVDVGGVGYLVHATPTTLATLRHGETATVATSMVVREDSMTLYGFGDADERDVFEVVQTVSGVGPRLALAMLAVHTPDALRRAVAGEDLAALTRVPGIGKKGAQRIVLELGDRLGPATGTGTAGPTPDAAPVVGDHTERVVEALTGLGWPAKQADEAVAKVLAETGAETVAADEVASTLRAALRLLGGHRG